MKSYMQPAAFSGTLIAVFVLFVICIITTGYFYYQNQKHTFVNAKQNELSAIADLKVKEIEQWRAERITDAIIIRQDAPRARQVGNFLNHTGNKQFRKDLLRWMQAGIYQRTYSDVFICDTNGNVKLSMTENKSTPVPDKIIFDPEVLTQHKTILSDLQLQRTTRKIYMDLIFPLVSHDLPDTLVKGVIVFRIDPYKMLFPLVQTWPTPSKTSETLIIQRKGDSVLFLNELRHRKNTALVLRLPVKNEKLPASMAVRGIEGTVSGIDYRNIPVIASLKKIRNSPWYMVSKVDQQEIYAPLREQMLLVIMVVCLLILITGLSIGFIWRNQHARFYRTQYEMELTQQVLLKRYNYLVKYANDIIVLADHHLKIIDANDAALDAYRYPREELIGLSLENLTSLEFQPKLKEALAKLQQSGGLKFEAIHLRKDGSRFEVEISTRCIEVEGSIYYQEIIRDISDRKKMEAQLSQSEELFRKAFILNPDSININRLEDGMYVNINDGFREIMGYDEAEVIGKTSLELNIWVDQADRQKLVEGLKKSGRVVNLEAMFRSKAGDIKYGLMSATIIMLNNIPHILSITRDISDYRKTREALVKSEEKLRTLFETMNQGVIYLDHQGKILSVNPAAQNILGLTLDEFQGKTIFDPDWKTIHEDGSEFPGIEHPVMQALKTGKFVKDAIMGVFSALQGKYIWIKIDAVPQFKPDDPKPYQVYAIFEDITERRKINSELKKLNAELESLVHERTAELVQSNEKFSKVFHYSPVGIVISRMSDGIFLDVNEAYFKLTGYHRHEIIGHNGLEINLFTQNEREKLIASLQNKDAVPVEMKLKNKSGKLLDVLGSAVLISMDGETCLLSAFYDISERRRSENEMKMLNIKLEEANRELESFSYSVSHDLRAPLRGINGFTRILEEDYGSKLDEEGRRICSAIRAGTTRMGQLIDNLLAFSHLGRSELHFSTVDMKTLAASAFSEVLKTYRGNQIEFTLEDIPVAAGDSFMLTQVWMNLISNAVKYSSHRRNPIITIGFKQKEKEIIYYIKDNGVGFDMQYAGKLFGVFQRLHSPSEFEGTGVGLAIVQRIIQRHGGSIWAEAEPDKGAGFYFTLPF